MHRKLSKSINMILTFTYEKYYWYPIITYVTIILLVLIVGLLFRLDAIVLIISVLIFVLMGCAIPLLTTEKQTTFGVCVLFANTVFLIWSFFIFLIILTINSDKLSRRGLGSYIM